jgi:hypothetical protein
LFVKIAKAMVMFEVKSKQALVSSAMAQDIKITINE